MRLICPNCVTYLRCPTATLPLSSSSRRTMADTLARSNSSVEERTSAGRDEGLANDTQGLGSQIVLSPDLFRPTDRAFARSVSPYRSCLRWICCALLL